MFDGLGFTCCGVLILIIVIIAFFSKQIYRSNETTIYKKLIICTTIGLLLDILCTITTVYRNFFGIFNVIVLKSYLVYLISWLYLFTIYAREISKKNETKLDLFFLKFMLIISVICVYILPISLVVKETGKVRYTTGMSVYFTYIISFIYILLIVFYTLSNLKKIKSKKYIPIFAFALIGSLAAYIQFTKPELLLMTFVESYIVLIMFFTIENPDVKMLNELYKNKEIMESNYEDKYNFLFEITQESRNPLKSIESICNNIENEKDIKVIKENVKDLSNLAKRLDFTINNVMNVSTLDAQKINIIDKKYNLKKVCEELTKRISLENKKDVEFKYSIPHNDLYLYGDDMKIKQVLYSLIMNSLVKTNVGYVEFKVNVIEKYDYARVIFMITDSGPGIEIDKINEILSATGALDKEEVELLNKKEVNVKLCQKVTKLMGGNLMIKSDLGKGSEFILTIDQRVYHDETKSILSNYENMVNNYQKALIVSQDKTLISKIKNILNKKDISYSVLYYGLDAVDKIKSHKKYDFILISDEMNEISGLSTLKEMQKIMGFNTPCIVMLNESKKGLAKHFIEDGFSDYLINEDIDGLNKILEKY